MLSSVWRVEVSLPTDRSGTRRKNNLVSYQRGLNYVATQYWRFEITGGVELITSLTEYRQTASTVGVGVRALRGGVTGSNIGIGMRMGELVGFLALTVTSSFGSMQSMEHLGGTSNSK